MGLSVPLIIIRILSDYFVNLLLKSKDNNYEK